MRYLKNNFLTLEYLSDALRIVGLIPAGKSNLLADLSNYPPVATPYGNFHFRGGHRLWHAPEAMPRTYIPDAGELTISDLPDGVRLEAPTEPHSRIRKSLEIRLAPNQPSATLTHTLTNEGLWPVELAAWAITQFRLGGTISLPMPVGNADPAGLLPNRQISLWPYASITDPRLTLGDDITRFAGKPTSQSFKLGYFNPHGWLEYELDGMLFRKTFDAQDEQIYPDNNSNAEIYACDQFVELESLSPLKMLRPGDTLTHIERWDVWVKNE